MKKNMKTRLFSGLMALCMLLALFPVTASAAEVPEYNTPEYPETSEGLRWSQALTAKHKRSLRPS